MYHLSEIKALVSKYSLSKEDVLLLSDLHHKRIPYKNVFFSSEYRRLTNEIKKIKGKYQFSFLDIGKFAIVFDMAPLITDSNYDNILSILTPKEIEEKKRIEDLKLEEKIKTEIKNTDQITQQNRIKSLLERPVKKPKYIARLTKTVSPLKLISHEIKKISSLKVEELTDFKTSIIENESIIIERGGDDKLFQFLKVDAFLQDYRNRILVDIEDIISVFDEAEMERAIIADDKIDKTSLEFLADNFRNSANILDGGIDSSFKGKMNRLFETANKLEPTVNKQIETMHFYNAIAFAMLVSFLENKKIRFFEIYSAFDKQGVFDNSWQKNVAAKLGSIDIRLANLNNQMTDLNDNFIRLAESSEDIAREMKIGFEGMNSRLATNNLLTAITTYQVYKINKNKKA